MPTWALRVKSKGIESLRLQLKNYWELTNGLPNSQMVKAEDRQGRTLRELANSDKTDEQSIR